MSPHQAQVAEFVRAYATELHKLAAQGNLETLAYLLEMVVLEADEVLECARDRVC